jgi:hypothetical protein
MDMLSHVMNEISAPGCKYQSLLSEYFSVSNFSNMPACRKTASEKKGNPKLLAARAIWHIRFLATNLSVDMSIFSS